MLSVPRVRRYLRVPTRDDDEAIDEMIFSAREYCARAGVAEADLDNPAVHQAQLLLVGLWYDNRAAMTSTDLRIMPFGVRALLSPFREVPDVGAI